MKAKQQLRKPEYWQDFENLCKKLWGEVWKCPEIKKNGRQGQIQHGVDVYGIPFGESEFYGIQCKGKDDYSKALLTENEINSEIEKAKFFKPKLKKLYFATTANKDSKIEAFVRTKNIEHIKGELFEVHLFSWEDIVDLIEENKHTYDYYVKSQNYKAEHKVEFVFENDKKELTVEVPFQKTTKYYKIRENPVNFPLNNYNHIFKQLNGLKVKSIFNHSYNHSICRFYFRLHNKGTEPLQEYKIFLDFNGDFKSIDTCTKGNTLLVNPNIKYNIFIWDEEKQGKIVPFKNILVPDDSVGFDTICLKPFQKETEVHIRWKLVSLNFKVEGELKLLIKPTYVSKEETIVVEDESETRIEEIIEDYVTD